MSAAESTMRESSQPPLNTPMVAPTRNQNCRDRIVAANDERNITISAKRKTRSGPLTASATGCGSSGSSLRRIGRQMIWSMLCNAAEPTQASTSPRIHSNVRHNGRPNSSISFSRSGM